MDRFSHVTFASSLKPGILPSPRTLELYSIALVFAQLDALHRASFLGTDVRSSAVTAAREARFTGKMMVSVPDAYSRYFLKNGSEYTISPEIRDRVRFEQDDIYQKKENLRR